MFLTSSKIIKHRNNVWIKFIFIYIYINIDNIFRKEIYEIKLIEYLIVISVWIK